MPRYNPWVRDETIREDIMTTDRAGDFIALKEQLAELKQRHAVLEAKRTERESERNELLTSLREAGIDVENLEAEADRLRSEISQAFVEAESSVSLFSTQISEAEIAMGTKTVEPEIDVGA
jgi:P2-related tail formation protein